MLWVPGTRREHAAVSIAVRNEGRVVTQELSRSGRARKVVTVRPRPGRFSVAVRSRREKIPRWWFRAGAWGA